MNIVVDALVIIAVIANKPQREVLIGVTKGVDLLAPPSVHWEIGNAFSAMLRRRRVTLAEVLKAIEVYRRIPIRFVEVELEDALRVAAEAGIYAYDACVIGCAQKYRAALIFFARGIIPTRRQHCAVCSHQAQPYGQFKAEARRWCGMSYYESSPHSKQAQVGIISRIITAI